jgi:hypothetical protein
MVSSGEELFHRSALRASKQERPPEGGPRVKAIRNWLLFRECTRMTLQSINCGDQVVAVEDLKQPFQKPLMVMRSWLKVLFDDALSLADGLKCQFLIGHACLLFGPKTDLMNLSLN